MMDCVLSGSLLVVFSLFCYAMCVFFRANKLSLSLSLLTFRQQLKTWLLRKSYPDIII